MSLRLRPLGPAIDDCRSRGSAGPVRPPRIDGVPYRGAPDTGAAAIGAVGEPAGVVERRRGTSGYSSSKSSQNSASAISR